MFESVQPALGSFPFQLHSLPPAEFASGAPRFALIVGSVVSVQGRRWIVERRIEPKWWFIDEETREPHGLTDRQLLDLQREGQVFVAWQPGDRGDARLPPHPLNIGESANKDNLRKMEYVSACLADENFCYSRRVLKPIIAGVAARRGETPYCFSTVVSWIRLYKRWGATFGPAAVADRHDRKGNRSPRLAEFQLAAIEIGIKQLLTKRLTQTAAYAFVWEEVDRLDKQGLVDKASLSARFLDETGRLKPPSEREFNRRCNKISPLLKDAMLIGAPYVRKNHRTFSTNVLPDRPYEQVEVDHCTLDVQIRHPKGTILGRPDLVAFRDRATSLILGWGVGFEEPSYASFLAGLKNAIYGQDVDRFPKVKNKPNWCGRIESLVHDNAFHFIGRSIEQAGKALGISLMRLQPREPWLKGAMEGWFGKLNQGLIHRVSGTTLSDPVTRRDHDNLGPPILTMEQLEELLARWICDVHNASPSRALGFIRGFPGGDRPLDAWVAKSKDYQSDLLPNPELFVALAGEITEATIQRNGVRLDHLIYEGPNLTSIFANPKHKSKARNGISTKYKVVRDPSDMGHVFLVDHHSGQRLEVPITAAHAEYATGLSLTEHEIIAANARRTARDKKRLHMDELMLTKAALMRDATAVLNNPSIKTVQRQLARFIEGDRLRPQRSQVQAFSPGDEDYLKPALPIDKIVFRSDEQLPKAEVSISKAREPIAPEALDFDDLDDLRKKKNWK